MASTTTDAPAAAATPTLKLTYFDSPGRAELSRLCLVQGGIEFEDYRMKAGEWDTIKPTTPHFCVPMLEVDGKQICQSNAIARYCAKLAGLYPEDPLLAAEVDSTLLATDDLGSPLMKVMYMPDGDAKTAAYEDGVKNHLPKWLGILEKQIADNGTGFAVGDKLTMADLVLYIIVNGVNMAFGGVDAEKYPKLTALRDMVAALPKIAARDGPKKAE